MPLTDRFLLIAGAVCHMVGMPLAEWVDVRWFCLVLAGEAMWLAYARKGVKGIGDEEP